LAAKSVEQIIEELVKELRDAIHRPSTRLAC